MLGLQLYTEGDFCASAWLAPQFATAADFLQAAAHVGQSISRGYRRGWMARHLGIRCAFRKSPAIVGNREFKTGVFRDQCDLNFRGGCMFDYIVQRFLEGKKQIVPNFR